MASKTMFAVAGGMLAVTLLGQSPVASARPMIAVQVENEKAPEGPLYYDISDDPNSYTLLALGETEKHGSKATLTVIDVFRSPNTALVNTWDIDCKRKQMQIVRAMLVQPGVPSHARSIRSAFVKPAASKHGMRMFNLACTGAGDLLKSRMHQGDLGDITRAFWEHR